jgi:ribosomal protein S18 acetylase RimI-like enzyme
MVTWPAGASVRPLEQTDAVAAVELANAIAAADDSGQYVTLEDFSDALAVPDFVPASDSLGVWSDGRLVGYGLVIAPHVLADLSIAQHKGGIHPDHRRRGFGGPLLDWLTERADALSRERHPGLLTAIDVGVQAVNTGALALLADRGYEPIRYFSAMQRPYGTELVLAAPAPAGFRVVGFDRVYDESLRLAHNEIFADHWGFVPKDPDHWKTWFTGHRAFRPALSYLVLDGERIAAYTLAYEFLVDTELTGVRELWAGQVGTRREYRGQGLASAALTAVLRAGQAAGFERAGLGVDTDSPTGAFRLYEKLGYRPIATQVVHRRLTSPSIPPRRP